MSSVVIAIFLLSIGASFVQRTTGFGFGIFIMTMLPYFMPTYGEATTLSGILAITTSAVIVWRLRRYVTWQRMWPILLTFMVVSTMAIFVLTRIEDHILRRILGVALIVETDTWCSTDCHQHLFCFVQPEGKASDNEAGAGGSWNAEWIDGRLLWDARPASGALLHSVGTHQGTLYGNGANVLPDR